MKLVEKLPDVASLRSQPRPRALDDGGIQSQPLSNVDARRRAGHADFQFIGRLQCRLIEADRRVHHAGRVCGVNFERRVVSGDDGDAADAAEVSGNGHGQGRAFLRIGGRTEFVQQHERVRGRGARNEINIGDVGGEGRKILLDRLIVADVGEHGVEYGKLGAVGGNGEPGLRHQREQAHGLEGDRFAAGVWAGDDELPAFAFQFHADRDDGDAFEFQVAFQQRMTGVVQEQASCARLGQPRAAVPT